MYTRLVLSLYEVLSFATADDWSVGSEYPYGPYTGLPSNAQPTIGECCSPSSLSFIKPDVFSNKLSLYDFYNLLNNSNVKFDGVDGNFYFNNNLIERELKILQINNGEALQIN